MDTHENLPESTNIRQILFDYLNPHVSDEAICQRHELTRDELTRIMHAPYMRARLEERRAFREERRRFTEPAIRDYTLQRLHEIATMPIFNATHADSIRKSLLAITRILDKDPSPQTAPSASEGMATTPERTEHAHDAQRESQGSRESTTPPNAAPAAERESRATGTRSMTERATPSLPLPIAYCLLPSPSPHNDPRAPSALTPIPQLTDLCVSPAFSPISPPHDHPATTPHALVTLSGHTPNASHTLPWNQPDRDAFLHKIPVRDTG